MARRLALALVFAALACAASSAQLPGNVQFSSSTPNAPTGYRNVTWQYASGGGLVDISAYVSDTANLPVCAETSTNTNAYTCTTTPTTITAIGATILFIPTYTNTGYATLTVNGALNEPIYITPTLSAQAGNIQAFQPMLLALTSASGTTVWQQVAGTAPTLLQPTFYANNSTQLASSWSAAYAFTNTYGQGSTIQIGPGSFNLTAPFIEPSQPGTGISLYGTPGSTYLWMSTNNSGSPWPAMISRPCTTGNKGAFTIQGLNLEGTPSGGTTPNASYGLNLGEIRGPQMILRDLVVENFGTNALGGENIVLGGCANTDSLGVFMQDVSTNYNEAEYTGPASGSGPTPPANGIHFESGMADSHLVDLQIRNATTCGIRVDAGGGSAAGIGGLYFVRPHAFGYASSNPQNYYMAHSFCDYDQSGVDHWIDAYADSPLDSAFDIGTSAAGIDIENPFFYWPGNASTYPTSNLFNIDAGATNVVVTNPVCLNKPYTTTTGAATEWYNASGSVPNVSGGGGCDPHDSSTGGSNTYNLYRQLAAQSDGLAAKFGSGANTDVYVNVAGTRMQFGYEASNGAAVIQSGAGKPVTFNSSNSWSSGYLAALSPYTGLAIGGSSYLAPAYSVGINNGIPFSYYGSLAAASAIAPVNAITAVSGTGSISTITAPPDCLQPAYAGFETQTVCEIVLIPTGAWSLVTGGNIETAYNATVNVPVRLYYSAPSAVWYVGFPGPSIATLPAWQSTACYSPTGIGCYKATGLTAAISTRTLFTTAASGPCSAGQYRIQFTILVTGNVVAGVTIYLNGTEPTGSGSLFTGTSTSAATVNSQGTAFYSGWVGASQSVTFNTSLSTGTTWPTYTVAVAADCIQ
jgi:hypothetical protein